jgi:hypothetical protein
MQWQWRNRITFNDDIAFWDVRMMFMAREPLRKLWCCRLQFGKWCVEEAAVLKTGAASPSDTLALVNWTVSRSFLQMFVPVGNDN